MTEEEKQYEKMMMKKWAESQKAATKGRAKSKEPETVVPQRNPPARSQSRAKAEDKEEIPVPRAKSRPKPKKDETGVPQVQPPARAKSRAKSVEKEAIPVPKSRSAPRAKSSDPESVVPQYQPPARPRSRPMKEERQEEVPVPQKRSTSIGSQCRINRDQQRGFSKISLS